MKPLGEGIKYIDLKTGDPPFTVQYDPTKVDVAKLLDALKASGEPIGLR